MPVVERDLAVRRAAVDARRPGVLLAAADAIRERVVGGDVIHRRRGLRVPVAPRRAAIGRDHAALVGDGEDDVRVVRVDPRSSGSRRRRGRRAPPSTSRRRPRCATTRWTRCRRRSRSSDRRRWSAGRRRRCAPSGRGSSFARGVARRRLARHASPVLAAIGGLVEADRARRRSPSSAAARRRPTDRVEHARVARRDGEVGLDDRRQPFRQLLPGRAAVGGLEDAVAGAAEALPFDEALLLLPERGVDDVRDCSDRCGRRCRSCTRPCRAPSRTSGRRRSSGKCRARRSVRTDGRAPRRRAGSGSCGSTSIIAIIWLSRRPRCVQVLPASVDLYMPSPMARSGRMMPAPVPT